MDYWQQQDQTYSDRLLAQRLAYAEQHKQATAEAYNALQARHAQLWQAAQTAYDRQQWDCLCRLTWALGKPSQGYLGVRGHWDELRHLLNWGIEAAQALGDKGDEAAFMGNLAIALQNIGDYATARQYYEQSLAITETLGDKTNLAALYHQLGMLAQDQGDYATARQRYEQSLTINEALGNQAGMATTYGQLAILGKKEGDLITAEQLYRQAWGMAEALGDIVTVSSVMFYLATMYEEQGRLAEAVPLLEQAVAIDEKVGLPSLEKRRKVLARVRVKLALKNLWEKLLLTGWLSRLWGWLRGK
jgi:tetratricopeptide (TPR) repeat protein